MSLPVLRGHEPTANWVSLIAATKHTTNKTLDGAWQNNPFLLATAKCSLMVALLPLIKIQFRWALTIDNNLLLTKTHIWDIQQFYIIAAQYKCQQWERQKKWVLSDVLNTILQLVRKQLRRNQKMKTLTLRTTSASATLPPATTATRQLWWPQRRRGGGAGRGRTGGGRSPRWRWRPGSWGVGGPHQRD